MALQNSNLKVRRWRGTAPRPKRYRFVSIAFVMAILGNSVSLGQQVQFPSSSAGAAPGTLNTSNPWNTAPPATGVFPPGTGTSGWPPPPSNLSTGTSTFGAPTITPIMPTNTSAPNSGVSIRPNSSPLLPPTFTGAPPTQPFSASPYPSQPFPGQPFPAQPYAGQPVTPTYPSPSNLWGLGNLFGTTQPQPYASATSPYGYPTGYPVGTVPSGAFPTSAPVFSNTYPPSVYPNAQPPTLFPSGFGTPTQVQSGVPMGQPYFVQPGQPTVWNPNPWQTPTGPMMNNSFTQDPLGYTSRFFVTPRFRQSWINGNDDPTALEINDSEVSALFQIPRFFGSTQPLYMAPSFAIHLWDGPSNGTADLPGSAYSAFMDFGWETNPAQTFGLETGIRIGVFTDFNTFNSDSLRIPGKIIGRARLTPNATARIGAYWLARNRIKLLPAAGILWTPNPDTRFDIFFPEPKLAHYLSTIGNKDCWWYVTGYYGGGAWTIQRADGTSDDIDLNDIRVCLGFEWGRNEALRLGQRCSFFEAGYAFNREVIYRVSPQDNLDVDSSLVLRAGFIY
jgi:hypothetical protein